MCSEGLFIHTVITGTGVPPDDTSSPSVSYKLTLAPYLRKVSCIFQYSRLALKVNFFKSDSNCLPLNTSITQFWNGIAICNIYLQVAHIACMKNWTQGFCYACKQLIGACALWFTTSLLSPPRSLSLSPPLRSPGRRSCVPDWLSSCCSSLARSTLWGP